MMTLNFDLLTLKLVRFIVNRVGKLPTDVGVSGTFGSLGQQLSDGPPNLFHMLERAFRR